MRFKIVFFIQALIFVVNINAQDTVYARRIVDTLASREYHGRGYTNDGMGKARRFLGNQFVEIGLKPLNDKKFVQEFSYPVNTFPGDMLVKLNGKELRPGRDYLVGAESRSLNGSYELTKSDSTHYINPNAKLIVNIVEKLTWRVSAQVADYTIVYLLDSLLKEEPRQIELDVESKRIRKFRTGNVCGKVIGTAIPDSFIVFTAHYDHLGEMGREAYFPGANDNASGVSMLLGLAKWFQKNPQPYSVAFIFFAGEEAGLIGSNYFTNHPVIPLQKISFLINIDLAGTGVDGITVVNATEFDKQFQMLKSVNEKGNYLKAVNSRGKAKNSDHYWFTEKGVPSFFLYTLGGIQAYHDVFDKSETLPMNEYADLHNLLIEFTKNLISSTID